MRGWGGGGREDSGGVEGGTVLFTIWDRVNIPWPVFTQTPFFLPFTLIRYAHDNIRLLARTFFRHREGGEGGYVTIRVCGGGPSLGDYTCVWRGWLGLHSVCGKEGLREVRLLM